MRKALPAQRSATLNQALENGQALIQAECFIHRRQYLCKVQALQWLKTVLMRAEVPGQLFPTPVIFITPFSVFCIHLKRDCV